MKCRRCGRQLRRGREEISKGVVVEAWRCTKCRGEVLLDMEQYARYYEAVQRRAFKIGGSLAIRIPKSLAEDVGIREGSAVLFRREGKGIVIEPGEA